MKTFVVGLILAACAFQSAVHAGDDSIKSTVRNRAVRKARYYRVKKARDIALERSMVARAQEAEVMRRRNMENEAHAAQMQHAINGANANAVAAQANAVAAERTRMLSRALGACPACGSFAHSACGYRP